MHGTQAASRNLEGRPDDRGFNLVELMPAADQGGRGALVAARIVAMMMGLCAGQKLRSG